MIMIRLDSDNENGTKMLVTTVMSQVTSYACLSKVQSSQLFAQHSKKNRL